MTRYASEPAPQSPTEHVMPFNILLILGGLSAFGPLAIDLYLPAFPAMASSFGTDIEHIQLSMSVYFLGLASGQIFYGPLADRFGRRKPLLFGIALFALASLACALAPSLPALVGLRFCWLPGLPRLSAAAPAWW